MCCQGNVSCPGFHWLRFSYCFELRLCDFWRRLCHGYCLCVLSSHWACCASLVASVILFVSGDEKEEHASLTVAMLLEATDCCSCSSYPPCYSYSPWAAHLQITSCVVWYCNYCCFVRLHRPDSERFYYWQLWSRRIWGACYACG